MSQTNNEAAVDLLNDVMLRTFFTKLAERGYVASNEEDAKHMLGLSRLVQGVKHAAESSPAAGKFYKAAYDVLAAASQPAGDVLNKELEAAKMAQDVLADPSIQEKLLAAL